jgi:hypothetical protein
MAAGTWQVYFTARQRLSNADYDLDADTFICILLDNAHTPDLNAHVDLTDVAGEEITDTDYSRVTLTGVTYDQTNGIVTFDCNDIEFATTADISARYAVIFDDNHAEDGLLCYVDLNDGGAANVSSSASQFLIQIAATGVFTLTQT